MPMQSFMAFGKALIARPESRPESSPESESRPLASDNWKRSVKEYHGNVYLWIKDLLKVKIRTKEIKAFIWKS